MYATIHRPSRQRGVTLIELIIVVIVVGLLAVIGAKSFSSAGISDNAKAQAMFESASKISQNAVLLAQAAGTSSDATNNTMPISGSNLLELLILGSSKLDTSKYPTAWHSAGVAALTDVAQPNPAQAGSFLIAGYPVQMGGGGANPHTFTFSNVPDSVVAALVVKYGAGGALVNGGDASNPVIQYNNTPGSGLRAVTIVRQL